MRDKLLNLIKAYKGDITFLPDLAFHLHKQLDIPYHLIRIQHDNSLDILTITLFNQVPSYVLICTLEGDYIYDS